MAAELTICIPHHGDIVGLYSTIASCESDLAGFACEHNYAIVTNGQKFDEHTAGFIQRLKTDGLLAYHFHSDAPLAPPEARQLCADNTTSELIAFFDNHCVLEKDCLKRLVADMRALQHCDILHAGARFFISDPIHLHYQLTLAKNFWGMYSTVPATCWKPYEILVAGHGAFIMRRSAWEEIGGYDTTSLLLGYGGEETLFNLKAAMMGKRIFVDSQCSHFHCPGGRGNFRDKTDEFFTNMMVAANVVGGEKWLYKVFESFSNPKMFRVGSTPMYELLMKAHERSADYAAKLKQRLLLSLDDLLVESRKQGVVW